MYSMTTLPRRLHLLLVLTFALACSSATAPTGDVTAVATDAGIRTTNGTGRPIFFIAAEQGLAGLLDFVPCTDASRCESIAPGATFTIAWSRVVGFDATRRDYFLIWWQGPTLFVARQMSGTVVVRR
jgi:hypothetical protein